MISTVADSSLLDAILDSWDRNNRILVNLLKLTREEHLDKRPMDGSPSVGELFMHLHYVRLIFVLEDAEEFARELPPEEWTAERDRHRMIDMLNESSAAVLRAAST